MCIEVSLAAETTIYGLNASGLGANARGFGFRVWGAGSYGWGLGFGA